MRRAPALLALLAALPLGGCVAAAAAIPILTAGGVTYSERNRDGERKPAAAPVNAAPPAATTTATKTAAVKVPQSAAFTVLDAKELPAPRPSDRREGDARQAWSAFSHHALAAAVDPAGNERHSAFLTAPGSLSPNTVDCGIYPPAVLIDLDPTGSTFDPMAKTSPAPGLAEALAGLRGHDIAVIWISGAFADAAPAIRSRLKASGLDPAGKDELLLLRYPDERKQERRASIADSHCLLAIAGDERGDFDELFGYLKSPNAAVALEPLIGDVWFLTPAPLG